MGTRMAVAFANISMEKKEHECWVKVTPPIFWKWFIDDIILLWTQMETIEEFLLKANSFHPTIKFTAEISETEMTSWTQCTKVTDYLKNLRAWCANTFQTYRDFSIHEFLFLSPTRNHERLNESKGEMLRLLRTTGNSSQHTFKENIRNFAANLKNRDHTAATVEKHLSWVKFSERKLLLQNKNRTTQKNSTLCRATLPGVAWLERNSHGEMAVDTQPTATKKISSRSRPFFHYYLRWKGRFERTHVMFKKKKYFQHCY